MFLPASFTPLWLEPAAQTTGGGLWFVFEAGKLLTCAPTQGDGLAVPEGDGPPIPVESVRCIGRLGEVACWCARPRHHAVPPGFGMESLRALFDRLPDGILAVAGRAAQVLEFDRTHRHCGACAAPTEASDGGRARRCPACGEAFYPRLAPAVMILVTRRGPAGTELLLATGSRRPGRVYSALAGFVEPSESLEDCARREVEEEVGVRIRGLRYFGSECWPFPHSLMVAFLAEHDGGEIRCQEAEIADAQWFPAGRLPALPHRLSVARRLIDLAVAEAE
jgi:NAD+ diphosphatase